MQKKKEWQPDAFLLLDWILFSILILYILKWKVSYGIDGPLIKEMV